MHLNHLRIYSLIIFHDLNTQARFHSKHVATCSSFSIDLETDSPHPSECIMDHPDFDDDDTVDDELLEKAEYEKTSMKLNPNGYRQVFLGYFTFQNCSKNYHQDIGSYNYAISFQQSTGQGIL